MEKGNILRTFGGYIYEYFTLRNVRKVFFFSLLAVLLFAIAYRLFESEIILKFFLAACVLSISASLLDSLQEKTEFLNEIEKVKRGHLTRLIKNYGENAVKKGNPDIDVTASAALSDDELYYIKQKKRQYNYSITVKLIFLAIFIVLLIQGV